MFFQTPNLKLQTPNLKLMLITNIKELSGIVEDGSLWKAGSAMSKVKRIKNAYLYIKGSKIADYGEMKSPKYQEYLAKEKKVVDAKGGLVLPAFCDSHTHLVYANSREMEFCDKIRGLSYEEIAKRGGGILNSAKATAAASEDEL